MDNKRPLLALALMCAAGLTQAGEKEELLKLRNTTTNLIKQLVKQGVITDKTAQDMIKQAEVDADQQVAEAKAATAKQPAASKEVVPADEVRVAYVPDFVKDEIRQQVRSELREEVVGDVMAKAKKEQWGLPGALPEWTRKFKLSGDMRLREQSSFMASDNQASSYFDWATINSSGGINNAGQNAYLNTTKNRHQGRERFRLGIDANIVEGVDASVRLATGNIQNPVSTNQTLGNTGARYQFNIDRAFLKYNAVDDNKFNWLTLMGGRTPNPFFTGGSELVWDEDLSFEGVMGTLRHRIGEAELSNAIGGKGPALFATAGIFPLQASTGMSARDKWMFGGQAGLDWGFDNQDSLKMGVGYFDYRNIQAKPDKNLNVIGSTCGLNSPESNQSAPQFMQFGNSLASICRDSNGAVALYGLASDYKILNINAVYDLVLFAPHHLKFSGDYAKNVGFNLKEIQNRYGNQTDSWGSIGGNETNPQTTAWQVRADLGWEKVYEGDAYLKWNVFTFYKYLERDAVLDAYTDSDFHLGGTNVKGWTVGGNVGLIKNVWLSGRWLSGNVITGPQYGVDILQLDLNTRF